MFRLSKLLIGPQFFTTWKNAKAAGHQCCRPRKKCRWPGLGAAPFISPNKNVKDGSEYGLTTRVWRSNHDQAFDPPEDVASDLTLFDVCRGLRNVWKYDLLLRNVFGASWKSWITGHEQVQGNELSDDFSFENLSLEAPFKNQKCIVTSRERKTNEFC